MMTKMMATMPMHGRRRGHARARAVLLPLMLVLVLAAVVITPIVPVRAFPYTDASGKLVIIEDQGLAFSVGTWTTPWSARFGHTLACTPSDALLVIGGLNISSTTSSANVTTFTFNNTTRDVWKSTTLLASSWTRVATSDTTLNRAFHATASTSNGVVLIGGMNVESASLNDCYLSTDGVSWSRQSTMPWATGRFGHNVAYDASTARIFVTGGAGGAFGNPWSSYDDVWVSSNDGVKWSKSQVTSFGARAFHASTVVSGTLMIVGGLTRNVTDASWTILNDVWYTSDAITFTKISSDLPFAPRFLAQLVTFNDQLVYLIGGYTLPPSWTTSTRFDFKPRSAFQYTSSAADVWLTIDLGNSWTRMQSVSTWSPRAAVGAALCMGNLYLAGGVSGTNVTNDVFYATVPVNQSGSEGAVVAGVLGSVCGLLILLVVVRRFQSRFDPKFVAQAALHAETQEENDKL